MSSIETSQLIEALNKRSQSHCELCASEASLKPFTVIDRKPLEPDHHLFLCQKS